ncbi:MAG: Mobile element protein, partial [uncultured Sphingosinicella sp.]
VNGPAQPAHRIRRRDLQPRDTCPLHADLGIVDQPGRALVCRTHPQAAAPRRPYLHQPARAGH